MPHKTMPITLSCRYFLLFDMLECCFYLSLCLNGEKPIRLNYEAAKVSSKQAMLQRAWGWEQLLGRKWQLWRSRLKQQEDERRANQPANRSTGNLTTQQPPPAHGPRGPRGTRSLAAVIPTTTVLWPWLNTWNMYNIGTSDRLLSDLCSCKDFH